MSFSRLDIPLASSLAAGLGVVVAGLTIGCIVVCAMKGKWWVAFLGFIFPVVILALPFCAIRLAKPRSFWARHWYDDDEIRKAEQRFSTSPVAKAVWLSPPSPEQSEPALPNPQDSEPWPDQDPAQHDRITRRALRRE